MTTGHARRIASIDVLRGFAAAVMVLVTVPGPSRPVFESLRGAQGLGWTGADLIAPLFVFIAGVALAVSPRTWAPWRLVIRRTALLWIVGVVVTLHRGALRDWSFLVEPLPALAAAYLVSVLAFRSIAARAQAMRVHWLIGSAAAALALHWLGWRWLHRPPSVEIGLLSPVATMLAGAAVGVLLDRPGHDVERVAALIVAGGFTMALALGWDERWAISARVGTGSFTLFAIGVATIAVAAAHWFVDVRERGGRRWLDAVGRNALAVFVVVSAIARALAWAPAAWWQSARLAPEAISLVLGAVVLAGVTAGAVLAARRGAYLRA